jgi:hypothetical protein
MAREGEQRELVRPGRPEFSFAVPTVAFEPPSRRSSKGPIVRNHGLTGLLARSSIAVCAKTEVPLLIGRRRADYSTHLGSAGPKIPASSKSDASWLRHAQVGDGRPSVNDLLTIAT